MGETESGRSERGRSVCSLFWPIILIAIGLIWLLADAGIIPRFSWWGLLRLWPLALIIIGLDMLLGRRWPVISALIAVLVVIAAVLLVAFGPAWGLLDTEQPNLWFIPFFSEGAADRGKVTTQRYHDVLNEASSAYVKLHLHEGKSTVEAIPQGDELIDAEITYYDGEIEFEAQGATERVILLRPTGRGFFSRWWTWPGPNLPWTIRLNRDVPLRLDVRVGSGTAELNLQELNLTELELRGGVGSASAKLPATDKPYKASVRVGSGSLSLDVSPSADLSLELEGGAGHLTLNLADNVQLRGNIEGGAGGMTIQVPRDAEVSVEIADPGAGGVRLPSNMQPVTKGKRAGSGRWETSGFKDAKRRISLTIEGGAGTISLQ